METVKDYIVQNSFLIISIILSVVTCVFLILDIFTNRKMRKLKKENLDLKWELTHNNQSLINTFNAEIDKLRNIHEGQIKRLQEENKEHRDNNRKLAMDNALMMGFGANKTIDMAAMIYKFYSGK